MSCIKEGCKEPKTENAYCKKHKVNFLIEEGVKRGERLCSNVIRGCRVVNDLTYTEEKQERGAVRSETNRKALCDRYGSEEYIKDKAKELALKRNGM